MWFIYPEWAPYASSLWHSESQDRHIVESNNCLACTETLSRAFLVGFLKGTCFTLTIKGVLSHMLPPGTVAYFVVNLKLTHLSITTQPLNIFCFPTACIVCVQYQKNEEWAFHLVSSCLSVLIFLTLFLFIFFLCPVETFRLFIWNKCSSWAKWSSGKSCTGIVRSPLLARAWPDKAINKPVWFWYWLFFEQEAGLCDLQKSLLTEITLWFWLMPTSCSDSAIVLFVSLTPHSLSLSLSFIPA